jgi:aminoglycoside phosphotransferase (APT) family kinase protein
LKRSEVDPSTVRGLLAMQFPEWADLDIEPVALGDNTTFRLGKTMSVRLPRAACYAPQIEKEYRWLPKLAAALPLPIPVPLGLGQPGNGYPWKWSVCRWLGGEPLAVANVDDLEGLAQALAGFLVSLRQAGSAGGPPPGPHNFFRGGRLAVYDAEARAAIAGLEATIGVGDAAPVWSSALRTEWGGAPVWVHGDVSASNLLVTDGRLSAVIDFGCMGVGDPACDLTIAWTHFSGESRKAFRERLRLDEATWARARGWALWKAAITLRDGAAGSRAASRAARRVIEDLLREHRRMA